MSDSYPRPEEPPVEEAAVRNPIGWIALALMLLVAVYALVGSFSASARASVNEEWRRDLQKVLVSREIAERFHRPVDNRWLRQSEAQLAPYRKTPETAAWWIAIRAELHEKSSIAEERSALRSKVPAIRDIASAYLMRPATPAGAATLAATLDTRGTLSRLASTHLREAAGLPGARVWIKKAADDYLLAMGVACLVGVGSLLAWIVLGIVGVAGRLPRLGPPYEAHNSADADRLAMRAAALFAAFNVLSIVFLHLSVPLKALGVGLSMLAVVPLVLRARPSFAEAVGTRKALGKNVLIGLWAFFLEIPVTMIVAGLGSLIFRNLPTNEHPAATALMNTHDLPTIAALLFSGVVVAPFWEETMFRGLLFPALRRVLNSPLWGALLSSFLFACIHPQGPGGWLGLMAFAVCSCVLTMRTRSLVPSIVMHAAHNATLLTIALLMGG